MRLFKSFVFSRISLLLYMKIRQFVFATFVVLLATSSIAQPPLRLRKLLLDDGAGGITTIQATGTGTITLDGSGGSFITSTSTTGQTIAGTGAQTSAFTALGVT